MCLILLSYYFYFGITNRLPGKENDFAEGNRDFLIGLIAIAIGIQYVILNKKCPGSGRFAEAEREPKKEFLNWFTEDIKEMLSACLHFPKIPSRLQLNLVFL